MIHRNRTCWPCCVVRARGLGNDPVPKPRGYFRIDLPEKGSRPFTSGTVCGEIPLAARSVPNTRRSGTAGSGTSPIPVQAALPPHLSPGDWRLRPDFLEDAHGSRTSTRRRPTRSPASTSYATRATYSAPCSTSRGMWPVRWYSTSPRTARPTSCTDPLDFRARPERGQPGADATRSARTSGNWRLPFTLGTTRPVRCIRSNSVVSSSSAPS